jgi:hypothetical protein
VFRHDWEVFLRDWKVFLRDYFPRVRRWVHQDIVAVE